MFKAVELMTKKSITVFMALLICPLFIAIPAYCQAGSDSSSSGCMLMMGKNSGLYSEPDGNRLGTVHENAFVKVMETKDGYMKIAGEGTVPEDAISKETGSTVKKTDVLDKNSHSIICTLKKSASVKVLASKNGAVTISYEGWIENPLLETHDENKDPYASVKNKASSITDPWFR